jgi:hypothetical protein
MLKLFISFWSARTHGGTHSRTQGHNTCLRIAQYFIECAYCRFLSSRRLVTQRTATDTSPGAAGDMQLLVVVLVLAAVQIELAASDCNKVDAQNSQNCASNFAELCLS